MLSNQEEHPRRENRILAALPPEEYKRLAPHLEFVQLSHGEILYQTGAAIEHVYFPTNALISLVSRLTDGASVEVGVIGYEGVIGFSLLLGVDKSPHETMAQIPGGAIRMNAETLLAEAKYGGALQTFMLRFIQATLLQVSQVVACNSLHSIEQRLARWLLMAHDRCDSDEFLLTQEFISLMLGVRRAGVTMAALTLQERRFIHYTRGHITILNRAGLEEVVCECYGIIKAEFDRLLSGAEKAKAETIREPEKAAAELLHKVQ